jgi:hypothetical protein
MEREFATHAAVATEPRRAPIAKAGWSPDVESLLLLHRSVGNAAVSALLQRAGSGAKQAQPAPSPATSGERLRVILKPVPQRQVEEEQRTWALAGIKGAKLNLPQIDPSHSPDFIDNRIEAVGFGVYEPGYYLYCSGLNTHLIVPHGMVDYGLTKARRTSDSVYPDYDTAVRQLPPGPYQRSEERSFAYYEAPGSGITLPTVLSPATAPVTTELMRGAVLGLVDYVVAQLEGVQKGIIVGGALRLGVHGALRIKFRSTPKNLPGLRLSEEPATSAGTGETPSTKTPAAPSLPEAYVPKRLGDPSAGVIEIKGITQTVYHSPGGNDPIPTKVFESGLPARGPSGDLWDHLNEIPGSGFRGGTRMPGESAGWDSDVVYKISGLKTYDVNTACEKIDKGLAGFSGNPMRGEHEWAFKAKVAPENIEGYYPVKDGKIAGSFVRNPNFRGQSSPPATPAAPK